MNNNLVEGLIPSSEKGNLKAGKSTQLKTLTAVAAMITAAIAGCGDDSESSVMGAHLPTPQSDMDAAAEGSDDVVIETAVDTDSQNQDAPNNSGEVEAGAKDVQAETGIECGSFANCNGTCVDTTIDTANCGSCGNACGKDEPYCSNGGCTECPDGLRNCHDGQGCVDFKHNDKNCSGCGNACDPGTHCVGGNCQ